MKPLVYIRADGSHTIGLGHLTRCFAFAQMLKENFDVSFFCMEIPPATEQEFSNLGFLVSKIQNENEFLTVLKKGIIVVLDGYTFTTDYQKTIKAKEAKLVCIDDIYDKEFFADLIINHSPGVYESHYKAQPYTKFALGFEYALLRPLFLEQAKKQREITKIETVLVCFGGSDYYDLTSKTVLELLSNPKFTKIILVIGSEYKNTEGLKILKRKNPIIDLRINLDETQMLATMLEADLAIVPSSGILFEVLACGCKVISGYYVENQQGIYNELKKQNAFEDAKNFSTESIFMAIKKVDAQKNLKLIDGNSKKRINSLFLNLSIDIRSAKSSDMKQLFEWANDTSVRNNAFNSEKIEWLNHVAWFNSKINSNDTYIFIAELNNNQVGQIRFDRNKENWLIDYSVDSKYMGRGIGNEMLALAIEKLYFLQNDKVSVIGQVKKGNISSIRVFEKLGFSKISEGDVLVFQKILG
ncbi:MAG: UDP-2,4-diacetamido-2,4,6-trideoxy-beta-L-altropyranose hydrolase [Bacteroidetes bacterium GWF2_38_335]|nr:MAG: UDP-2,4-diacetamido-2,4,6-trideoxy-beta-L-altropyranose hydrolase [Bacteroidetes bacterium GWF2_38_335]OFY77108.1 MAG: UDP-2,4-diacetamido-2,4,6-trideoxy-beta-L-altropyranose hydrolase [Bacteroidetes bacterium RIFOXYA12_FULL_38_20]HBS84999.1 UDP-2,4-diacetamido-2,4,6-trideoxy-beta-L-altropyranose hydrolase [Bacteroidales bacterium]